MTKLPETPGAVLAANSENHSCSSRLRHSSFDHRPAHTDASPDADQDEIIGASALIKFAMHCIDRVATSDAAVLITGETGTGKELFARRLHVMSDRKNGPLISVNCAAIPDSLLESELFGFEKGAFTGAGSRQEGRLIQANGGTVFLDEIGDLSPAAQAKILRVLEEKEVTPLGSRTARAIDVRFVTATNRDLAALIGKDRFREDLFFRINVVNIDIPPLRERQEDIPLIADHFLEKLSRRYNRLARISPRAQEYLKRQPWIGNVRELRNVIERTFLFLEGEQITEQDFLQTCHSATRWHSASMMDNSTTFRLCSQSHVTRRTSRTSVKNRRVTSSECSERDQLRKVLEETKWNKSKAAEILQWSRMTIYRKIAAYDLHPPATSPQTKMRIADRITQPFVA